MIYWFAMTQIALYNQLQLYPSPIRICQIVSCISIKIISAIEIDKNIHVMKNWWDVFPDSAEQHRLTVLNIYNHIYCTTGYVVTASWDKDISYDFQYSGSFECIMLLHQFTVRQGCVRFRRLSGVGIFHLAHPEPDDRFNLISTTVSHQSV